MIGSLGLKYSRIAAISKESIFVLITENCS